MNRTKSTALLTAVIVILAVGLFSASMLVVPRLIAAQLEKNRRGSCEALLSQVQMAMKTYQLDYGALPSVGRTLHGVKTPVLDPWGRPLVFRHVRTILSNNSSTQKVTTWMEYRVHSVGPNGIDDDGQGDDVTSN